MAPTLLLTLKLLIWLMRIYQLTISLLLKPNCRFWPTCSEYGIEVFQKFGILEGSLLTLKRILKCHPWNQGGEDIVPLNNFDKREN